ncbi:MAG: 23S rRNA (pseudouridine(1915)-N(3))-methyltransferase RlmH [Patescibacteria group bacterium]
MYSFTLLVVSASKPGPWKDLAQEYQTRLTPYAKCKLIEIPQAVFSSAAERQKVQAQEAEVLRKSISKGAYTVACDERGKFFTSTQFAQQLKTWSEQETRNITFLLGGPLGLQPALVQTVQAKLALSSFTFPHDLARVVLLEQLYRAMTILKGKTYHY